MIKVATLITGVIAFIYLFICYGCATGSSANTEEFLKIISSWFGIFVSIDFLYILIFKHKANEFGVLENKKWALAGAAVFMLCFTVLNALESLQAPLAIAKTCVGH